MVNHGEGNNLKDIRIIQFGKVYNCSINDLLPCDTFKFQSVNWLYHTMSICKTLASFNALNLIEVYQYHESGHSQRAKILHGIG